MQLTPLPKSNNLLQILALLIQRHTCISRTPDPAFDISDDLSGASSVRYWATKGSNIGFVPDDRHVGSCGVENLLLKAMINIRVSFSQMGCVHNVKEAECHQRSRRVNH
jgi:hypothetical protein